MFTGDDLVVSKEHLKQGQELSLQPQPERVFIAGVASGINATRTIVITLGKLRPFANLLNQHVMSLTNKQESRKDFMTLLQVQFANLTKSDWTVKGDFIKS